MGSMVVATRLGVLCLRGGLEVSKVILSIIITLLLHSVIISALAGK